MMSESECVVALGKHWSVKVKKEKSWTFSSTHNYFEAPKKLGEVDT